MHKITEILGTELLYTYAEYLIRSFRHSPSAYALKDDIIIQQVAIQSRLMDRGVISKVVHHTTSTGDIFILADGSKIYYDDGWKVAY